METSNTTLAYDTWYNLISILSPWLANMVFATTVQHQTPTGQAYEKMFTDIIEAYFYIP